jgi:chromosome segregation ATPase
MRITEEGLKAKEREYGAVKERLDEMERLNSHLQVNSEF